MFAPILLSAAALAAATPQGFGLSEIGGRITVAGVQTGIPRGHPVELRLYSDTACLTSTAPDVHGTWLLRAPPGDYWLSVVVNGREAQAVRAHLGSQSVVRDLVVRDPAGDWLGTAVPGSLTRKTAWLLKTAEGA
jgi:hypothetical protein